MAQYLRIPPGEPNPNLLDMLRDGLSARVRSAIHHVIRESKPVEVRNAQVKRDDRVTPVIIQVRPIKLSKNDDDLLLVSFADLSVDDEQTSDVEQITYSDAVLIRQLEEDLKTTKEDLQSTIEEMETSNEEVMSINEELQFANEELETSKEELQSLNEELITVNNQLEDKVIALQQTHNDITNFLTSTQLATLFLDAQLHIKRFTPASTALFNLIPTDIGRPLEDISRKFSDPDLLNDAREVLAKLTPISLPIRDENGHWFIRRTLPYRTQDNKIDGVVITFTDISQLHENERRLATEHAVAQLMVEANDWESTVPKLLDTFVNTFEADLCEFWIEESAPDTLQCKALQLSSTLAHVAPLSSSVAPIPIQLSSGGFIAQAYQEELAQWVSKSDEDPHFSWLVKHTGIDLNSGFAFPITSQNHCIGVMSFFTREPLPLHDYVMDMMTTLGLDIGEFIRRSRIEQTLRNNETRLSVLFAQASAGLAQLDRDGRFTMMNERFCDIVGRERDDLLSRYFLDILNPDNRPHSLELFNQLMADGQHFTLTQHILRPDESKVWVHQSVSGVPDDAGTICSVFMIIIDVSAQKEAESTLIEARALAESANQSKNDFLAKMSHEIRTPMSAILGYADILAENVENPDDLAGINIIQNNGHHLLGLINDILDISKIEANQLSIDIERFAPAALVSEVYALMAIRAHENGLGLNVEFSGKLPILIESDPRRVKQILINLLGNAIKFTPEGQVRLIVSLIDDIATSLLQFAVADTGIGINPDDRDNIFQPFWQSDNSTAREYSGTGLGLAISKLLAELLGGTVTVQSNAQGGTTFTATIATGSLTGIPRIVPELTHTTPHTSAQAPAVRLTGRFLGRRRSS